jgi:hypothetical protein
MSCKRHIGGGGMLCGAGAHATSLMQKWRLTSGEFCMICNEEERETRTRMAAEISDMRTRSGSRDRKCGSRGNPTLISPTLIPFLVVAWDGVQVLARHPEIPRKKTRESVALSLTSRLSPPNAPYCDTPSLSTAQLQQSHSGPLVEVMKL